MNHLGINNRSRGETQITVHDKDKNVKMLWDEFEFDEKLEMMREALRLYEDQQQNKQKEESKRQDEEKEYEKITKEIFDIDLGSVDSQDDFLGDMLKNLNADDINRGVSSVGSE